MDEDQSQTKKNSNPSYNTMKEKQKKKVKINQFEFCKVCRLNHDQGRRHNYFPNHTKSLSSFLSRFQSKLSDLRFFLKNPSLIRPEHASRNRLWCVFCDSDIDEVGISFTCGNAINHLASADHFKNLKRFLWKHGGGMDRMDSFRISEGDLAKWEKKCKSLKSDDASEGSCGPLVGPLNDIHNELNSQYIDSFCKNNIHSLNSSISNGVVPLQNYTNERYQVSHSEVSRITEFGASRHDANSYLCVGTQFDTYTIPCASNDLTGYVNTQRPVSSDARECSSYGFLNIGGMYQAYRDERTANGESGSQGLQNLTQISSTVREEAKGNVHSGAPPPWFDETEGNKQNVRLKSEFGLANLDSSLRTSSKSSKLNPKRVGAAWAERRKIELEMEKRGELVINNFDGNWLPNFGRVWQSGSRKESRKEFELENSKPHKVESDSDMAMQLQPYISKRMRKDASD